MELDYQLRKYSPVFRLVVGARLAWRTNNNLFHTLAQPDYQELRAYFDHVDKVFEIKKDCSFRTVVTGAEFDKDAGKWNVTTADSRTSKARFLILGSGFVSTLLFRKPCLFKVVDHPFLSQGCKAVYSRLARH